MSFVEMREQAGEPAPPKHPIRLSNRISFTQQHYADKKMEDERARRGSFPGLCDDSCLRARNEFRLLEEFAEFKPQMYNFEIEDYDDMKSMVHSESQQTNLQIKCPDFFVLFDHTIAMIYQFYHDKKNWKKFTIPQVEWALKFIDAIKSCGGAPFTDMETIKKHLEEFLFIAYSEVDTQKFIEPIGVLEKPKKCISPGYKDSDIPFSLRELFHNRPSMLPNVLGPPPAHMAIGHTSDSPQNEKIAKALLKLEEFEWKNIQRINDEIDMFDLIKCIKTQMGENKDSINARDLSNLKDKIGNLENRWVLHNKEK